MLSSPLQLPKVVNYSLLAVCMIALTYYFLYNQGQFLHYSSGASAVAHHGGIPKILWYKLGPHGLSEATRSWTDTCIKQNPHYRAKFMTDENDDDYVRKNFAFRPDIVDTYLALPVPIFKADMLRYLLLWDKGGVWSDLDVSCESIPIDDWIPAEYREKAALVVGWEFDSGWSEPFARQFASWTIMAKPRLPHMMQVVDGIIERLREETTEHNVTIANVTLDMMGDVVDFTGPRRLTHGVFTSLEKTLGQVIDLEDLKNITQPRLIEDVLVMPGNTFAASSNTYPPELKGLLPPPLVTHHYAGSWKNKHGGEE